MLGKAEHGSSVLNYSYVLVSNFFLNTLKLNVPGEIYIYIYIEISNFFINLNIMNYDSNWLVISYSTCLYLNYIINIV